MVPVALLGAELDGEATGVTSRVGGSTLATDGREAGGRARLVADLGEDVGAADVGDVVGDLKDTVGSGALGVDDTLGDPLAVKVGETDKWRRSASAEVGVGVGKGCAQVDVVEVLEDERAVEANALGRVRLLHGLALRGGVGRTVGLRERAGQLAGRRGINAGRRARTLLKTCWEGILVDGEEGESQLLTNRDGGGCRPDEGSTTPTQRRPRAMPQRDDDEGIARARVRKEAKLSSTALCVCTPRALLPTNQTTTKGTSAMILPRRQQSSGQPCTPQDLTHPVAANRARRKT